jgi:hypothetical protein
MGPLEAQEDAPFSNEGISESRTLNNAKDGLSQSTP